MGSRAALAYQYASTDEVLAASIVLPILSILAVGARFAARLKQRTLIGKDDIMISLALVCLCEIFVWTYS